MQKNTKKFFELMFNQTFNRTDAVKPIFLVGKMPLGGAKKGDEMFLSMSKTSVNDFKNHNNFFRQASNFPLVG